MSFGAPVPSELHGGEGGESIGEAVAPPTASNVVKRMQNVLLITG